MKQKLFDRFSLFYRWVRCKEESVKCSCFGLFDVRNHCRIAGEFKDSGRGSDLFSRNLWRISFVDFVNFTSRCLRRNKIYTANHCSLEKKVLTSNLSHIVAEFENVICASLTEFSIPSTNF